MVVERETGYQTDPLDKDNEPLRGALAWLCQSLAGQLGAVSGDILNGEATARQCIRLAAVLDRLAGDVTALRRETDRLKPRVTAAE